MTFRVFDFNIQKKIFRLDSSQLRPKRWENGIPIDFDFTPSVVTAENLFDSRSLQYNGSFARGVSLGNAQNLVLNSQFNLNISGKIANDLELTAAISDQNIPLQAEGNTQQLREFDRLFIQLKKKNQSLLAGDYELTSPQKSYFLRYYKKMQGATYQNTQLLRGGATTWAQRIGAAVARGKFARQTLAAQEGNQGPYRLTTEGGQALFVILSGTERVWLDGQLLVRGDDADYIMDYNSATIRFTPRRLVTQFSRIVVEFDYADQTYLRSAVFVDNELKFKNIDIRLNFYTEQDSKNSTGTQSLDSLDRLILAQAGAAVDGVFVPALQTDSFSITRVMYRLRDTLWNGQRIQILEYSKNPDNARIIANFTPVGDGKGNYMQDLTATANGRVYRWVAPDAITGQPRGSFEPVRRLTPPTAQQMLTAAVDYQILKNLNFSTEWAISRLNRNTFSELGDSAGLGGAVFNTLTYKTFLDTSRKWEWRTSARHEYRQQQFVAFAPYRAQEFSRDWNLASGGINAIPSTANTQFDENWLAVQTFLTKKDSFSMQYEFSYFNRSQNFLGQKHVGRGQWRWRGFDFRAEQNYLVTEGGIESTLFSRPKLDISKDFNIDFANFFKNIFIKNNSKKVDAVENKDNSKKNIFKIGLFAEREKNERRDFVADTLNRSAFYYDFWKIYFSNQQKINGNYSQRFDYLPNGKNFSTVSKTEELFFSGNLATKKQGTNSSNLTWNLTYRNLKVTDSSLTNLQAQKTYLGRLEYNGNYMKNFLYLQTLYELGSGQEQRIEYQYVKVQKGEGQYVWNNRNSDTIPQLDEFDIAPFRDQADWVRVTIFTNQFVRTNNVAFTQSLRLEPQRLWANPKGVRNLLSKFGWVSTLQINRRVRSDAPPSVSQINPLELRVPNPFLIGLNFSMRNQLNINRGNVTWDADITQTQNEQQQLLSTGYDLRRKDEWTARVRWNLTRRIMWTNLGAIGTQQSASELLKSRDFDLHLWRIEQQLTWLNSESFRLIAAYKLKYGENIYLLGGGEKLESQDFSMETTWNQASKTQIRAKMAFVAVNFEGQRNTPAEFTLLEGLQSGKNWIWTLGIERMLPRGVQLTLSYEGRKTGDLARVVHVGRAQVRANF